jgi:hypothetical protein
MITDNLLSRTECWRKRSVPAALAILLLGPLLISGLKYVRRRWPRENSLSVRKFEELLASQRTATGFVLMSRFGGGRISRNVALLLHEQLTAPPEGHHRPGGMRFGPSPNRSVIYYLKDKATGRGLLCTVTVYQHLIYKAQLSSANMTRSEMLAWWEEMVRIHEKPGTKKHLPFVVTDALDEDLWQSICGLPPE